jgi:hypothetical protein
MSALGVALPVVPGKPVWLYLVSALELAELLLGVERDLFLINKLVLES